MMRILFVYTEIDVKFGRYGFQQGIAALSAYLKRHGTYAIHLFHSSHFDIKSFKQKLSTLTPHIIGFYTTHDQLRFIKDFLQEIKDEHTFTICGGPHATLNPDMIYETPRLNAVCVGEGEKPMLELVKVMEKNERPLYIKGLWLRNGKNIIRNPPDSFLANLNELPFVDRELFSETQSSSGIGLTRISYQNSFKVSRGCPFPCSFCSNRNIGLAQPGSYVRFRSVDNVLTEIEDTVKRYSPSEIYFQDDSFTINGNFIDEFCKKYPKRIGLPFEFLSHIGPSTIEILRKLKKAGGRRVSFGIESGNESLRREIIRKEFSNDDVIRTLKEAKKIGYQTEAYALIGIPDETPTDFNDTVKLLKRIQPDMYTLCSFFPYQGTDLYFYSVRKGYIRPDFSIPRGFVVQRDLILRMPQFPRIAILREYWTFGLKIYLSSSLLKALLFPLYEFKFGNALLKYLSFYKNGLRKLIMKRGA